MSNPILCHHCGQVGHKKPNCPLLGNNPSPNIAKSTNVQQQQPKKHNNQGQQAVNSNSLRAGSPQQNAGGNFAKKQYSNQTNNNGGGNNNYSNYQNPKPPNQNNNNNSSGSFQHKNNMNNNSQPGGNNNNYHRNNNSNSGNFNNNGAYQNRNNQTGGANSSNYQRNNSNSGYHSQQSNYKPPKNNFPQGAPTDDFKRFIASTYQLQPDQISKSLARIRTYWTRWWELESPQLTKGEIEHLFVLFAKIPNSSHIHPPPIRSCCALMKRYADLCSDINEPYRQAMDLVNITNALLRFDWIGDIDDIKKELKEMLAHVLSKLISPFLAKSPDFMTLMKQVYDLLSSLDLHGTIRTGEPGSFGDGLNSDDEHDESQEEEVKDHQIWKSPNVGWLDNPNLFVNSLLPKMLTPTDKSSKTGGLYPSTQEYLKTVQSLWVAMTFNDGWKAINPTCHVAKQGGDMPCGNSLWPSPDALPFYANCVRCKQHGHIVVACPLREHHCGYCQRCFDRAKMDLIGPPSERASTHLYDGVVTHVDWEGRVCVSEFVSRRPPRIDVNWKTTSRLNVSTLVGVVILQDRGQSLTRDSRIIWCELVIRDKTQDLKAEQQMRVNRELTVQAVFDKDAKFRRGDAVVVIDCKSFVPEYIPVLKAICQQNDNPIPFDNGKLLNMCPDRHLRGDDESEDEELKEQILALDLDSSRSFPEVDHQVLRSRYKSLQLAIAESKLDPIICIRRSPYLHELLKNLANLVKQTTLDDNQFKSFIAAITYPVHCCQGPPGTGKSYLGVALVRALLIIRQCWIKAQPTIGRPTILVVAYKNHAIDEFLLDLHNAQSYLKMVRIGGGCKESALEKYEEKRIMKDNSAVKECYKKLELVHRLRTFIQEIKEKHGKLALVDFESLRPDQNSQASVDCTNLVSEVLRFMALFARTTGAEASKFTLYSRDRSQKEGWKDRKPVTCFTYAECMGVEPEDLETVRRTIKLKEYLTDFRVLRRLMEDSQHLNLPMPLVALRCWIEGRKPNPRCVFVAENNEPCATVALDHIVKLCAKHRCGFSEEDGARCPNRRTEGKFCVTHRCGVEDCDLPKLPDQNLCHEHACIYCLKIGMKANEITDKDRDTCVKHVLCIKELDEEGQYCENLVVPGGYLCEEHNFLMCSATTKKKKNNNSKSCPNPAISKQIPFCNDHKHLYQPPPEPKLLNAKQAGVKQCATMKKKGGQCRGSAMPGMKYCRDHIGQYADVKDDIDQEIVFSVADVSSPTPLETKETNETKSQPTAPNTNSAATDSETSSNPTLADDQSEVKRVASKDLSCGVCFELYRDPRSLQCGHSFCFQCLAQLKKLECPECRAPIAGPVDNLPKNFAMTRLIESAKDDVADASAVPVDDGFAIPDECEQGREFLDADEAELPENYQDMQDIYEIEQNADALIYKDDAVSQEEAKEEESKDGVKGRDKRSVELPKTAEWNFELSPEMRRDMILELMDCEMVILGWLDIAMQRRLVEYRKEYHQAKVKADSQIYEGREVIGGTIVGCITRLEAIKSTQPFAILVEEASEVMEPLLFACLGSSLRKLEMIGDQRQLRPSLSDKYDFERVNKMNISMFERLILSRTQLVPSNVLSIQRRMRRNICDLTRDFYLDITTIQDHETCSTKVISLRKPNEKSIEWEGSGREVPGILPHVFFWTHDGRQERSAVGLSRANPTELKMTCALANYLVACGVPKSNIAILTPYKGQLLAIMKELKNYPIKNFGNYPNNRPQELFQLSTVDRFQGDEADIVIISLVVDAKSRTPFVLLQNRMIVLLSRARIGMYIIGNKSYLDSAKDSGHWHTTLSSLQKPAPTSDTTAFLPRNTSNNTNEASTTNSTAQCLEYNGPRMGDALPICCPKHRSQQFKLTDCSQFSKPVCKLICYSDLKCGHLCDLPCHFAKPDAHRKQCQIPIQSPCPEHQRQYLCYEFVPNFATQYTVEERFRMFQCEVNVVAELQCGHEFQYFCHESRAYLDGTKSWPLCHKPSLQPFYHPACKHKWDCTCTQYARAKRSPESVPLCSIPSTYTPLCGHAVQLKCSDKQRLENGQATRRCTTTVDRKLPRCGHDAQVSCAVDIELRNWTGKSVTGAIQVEEGVSYGPVDFDCQKNMKFLRRCGHHETLKCRDAFERAAKPTKCNCEVKLLSPFCGHLRRTQCHNKAVFETYPWKPQVQTVKQAEISTAFNFDAQLDNYECKDKVTVIRACGHEVKNIDCCVAARNALNPCAVEKKLRSPLCGHEIIIHCSAETELLAWKPWTEQFKKSPGYRSLTNESILDWNAVNEYPSMLKSLPACRAEVTIRKPCGHVSVTTCSDAFSRLQQKALDQCRIVTKLTRPDCPCEASIECHRLADFQRNPSSIPCQTKVQAQCWNFEQCANTVESKCHDSRHAQIVCNKKSHWRCPNCDLGLTINQCLQGVPSPCFGCHTKLMGKKIKMWSNQLTNQDMMKDALANIQKECSYLQAIFKVATPHVKLRDAHNQFFQSRQQLFAKFASHLRELKAENYQQYLKTPLFSPNAIPVFSILPRQSNSANTPGNFGVAPKPSAVANGVELLPFTARNLEWLHSRRGENLEIAIGFAYTCLLCIWHESPIKSFPAPTTSRKKKGQQQENPAEKYYQENRKKWNEDRKTVGYDSVLFSTRDADYIIFTDPYCVLATHSLRLTDHFDSRSIDRNELPYKEELAPIMKPEMKFMPGASKKVTQVASKGLEIFKGSYFADLCVISVWNGRCLFDNANEESDLQLELQKALFYPGNLFSKSKNEDPLAGSKCLKAALEELSDLAILKLHLALEYHHLSFADQAKKSLDEYINALLKKSLPAHPLFLLALARIDPEAYRFCFRKLCEIFPNAVDWLLEAEKGNNTNGANSLSGSTGQPSVSDEWEQFKNSSGVGSDAMDELMRMTGIRKVKAYALKMFKLTQGLKKMSAEARKKNKGISLNFAFVGNPGTGKTTVARLFAQILFDSGARAKNTFIEVSAQDAKSMGPDKFKKEIKRAEDGVLFIDEAYELDPGKDSMGKAIVSEILTNSENNREHLSIILAGYEDDIQEKLYRFNEGLRSRFETVYFEDFDRSELRSVWDEFLRSREWYCEEKAAKVVVNRLVLCSKSMKKGFGNARDVRKVFESHSGTVMAKEDFDGTLTITLEDVAGVHPLQNEKLKSVLQEINDKIGWSAIKKSVNQLIEVVRTNYDRECDGLEPLDLSLNKLLLGNPGTGKTTFAHLYGKLLKALNLLTSGEVVSKAASDFIGGYIGQSQTKTNDILQLAQGKVLLIDEAYALNDSQYGGQVLDTLVEKVQGSPSDNIVVLMIGYEKQMLQMIRERNPGLARRFPPEFAFRFDDYEPNELLKIWTKYCQDREVKFSPEVADKALEILKSQKNRGNFGNAGAVEQLIKNATMKASSRKSEKVGVIQLRVEDLASNVTRSADPFAALDKLYNVGHIKKQIQDLQAAASLAKRESKKFELGHFMFCGSPGTGKTTVARVIANILYDLELVSVRDRLVETSGMQLVGDYVGQTKTKVWEKMKEANGGVLFIDEAYMLMPARANPFAEEAVATLIEGMTSTELKGLVVIIAGYQKQIDDMLNTCNPGLKSRFTHLVEFKDWTAENCCEFFVNTAKNESYQIEDGAIDIFREGIIIIQTFPNWGNGRDVTQIWKDVYQARATRLQAESNLISAKSTAQKKKKVPKLLACVDVQKAINLFIEKRRPKGGNVNTNDAALNSPDPLPMIEDQFALERPPAKQSAQQLETAKSQTPKVEEKETKKDQSSAADDNEGRDDGVSQVDWEELQRARKEYEAMLERLRKENDQKKLAEELAKQKAVQEKIRQICPCPMGYAWYQVGRGWRCRGGSHFVSDEELNRSFAK